MSLIKPSALKRGATFGIVSPASTPRPDLVQTGIEELQRLGYSTRLFPHALDRGPLYYAGSPQERAGDLHAAFADAGVDAILCTRGGWGSAELLPLLDRELIRANPKPFLGYSDQTSLHVWLRENAQVVSFQAPMVAADWSKPGIAGVDLASWRNALESTEPWELGSGSGLRVLRPGTAEGELTGGCCSIFVEALGTPYAPQRRGGVLFLEDVGVKPYQWDRMLVHLRHGGLLENVTGIVFGDMEQCCESAETSILERSLLYALRDFEGPVAIGLRSGHVSSGNITLPFGVNVLLDLADGKAPRLCFPESAVKE